VCLFRVDFLECVLHRVEEGLSGDEGGMDRPHHHLTRVGYSDKRGDGGEEEKRVRALVGSAIAACGRPTSRETHIASPSRSASTHWHQR
jgi:hypothetical protein